MTGHAPFRDHLAYYRDLSPGERRAADEHLAHCAGCRALLAAYEAQDTVLASIPGIRARRALRPNAQAPSLARRALGRLGDALALGGLAALLVAFAWQVQAISQGGTAGSGTPGNLIPEPGITLPPTSLRLPSPWLPALPWVGAALLLVGLLFIFSRRSRWPVILGALASALLLTGFVPPFSAVPNPVAVYWRLMGGYAYDPQLPFKNSSLIAGSPERQLVPYVDRLIGQVGLTPLDPAQPLDRYEVLRVGLHPAHNRTVVVITRFIYADGSSRIYQVPLLDPVVDIAGFYLAGWRSDGLERLRSEHLALPGQPFAGPDATIQIGTARRLDSLHPAGHRLDEVNPAHWLWDSVRVQRLVWAPDGGAFLAAMEVNPAVRRVWLVRLDGSAPVPIAAGDIREYGWSPDGAYVVYTRLDPDAQSVDPFRPFAIMAVNLSSPARGALGQPAGLATGLPTSQLPGLTDDGAWFISGGSAWLAPYGGATAQLAIQQVSSPSPDLQPWPAPDGTRLAYACGRDLCLVGRDGSPIAQIPGVRAAEAAWTPDGSKLAVIDRDPNDLRPVRLVVVAREGQVVMTRDVAPRDAAEPPQWTPDGQAVFVQTYPQNGRRIIAVDLSSGQVLDLSQEHWDAYFALSPDGKNLLLNNGRGDFWVAEVIR